MLIERHNGCPVFAGAWQDFLREWRAAAPENRVVLPDNRPAVRKEPEGVEDRPSYTTVHAVAWESIRPALQRRLALTQHPKRARLCQACGAEMRVAQELEQVWSFQCPQCRSVETWGKNLIGGQMGAGEKEKT